MNISKERIQQTTAPGSYNIVSEIGKKKDPNDMFKKKSANERLKDIGLFPTNLSMEQDPVTVNTKKNYYAPEGTQDYLIGEA